MVNISFPAIVHTRRAGVGCIITSRPKLRDGLPDRFPNGRLPAAHKKSASLRQHTLDDQPSCRHTGNVIVMSSEIFGLQYTSWTTDIGDAGGNAGLRDRDVHPRSAFICGRRILGGLGILLYYGFRSATPSATVFSAIHAACST